MKIKQNRNIVFFEITTKTVVHSVVFIFFFLMLIIPTTYQAERGAILALLIMAAVIAALQGRGWQVHRDIVILCLLTVTGSLFFMLRGEIASGPGAFRVGTVYVLWPLLFLFFMGVTRDLYLISGLFKVIVLGTSVAAIMGMGIVAGALGHGIPGLSTFLKSQGPGVGVYEGYIEYRLYNMTTLIYALPFLITSLFVPLPYSTFQGKWRPATWAALLLTIVAMMISGRRIFWLIGILSPVVVFFLFLLTGLPLRRLFRSSLIVAVLGVTVLIGGIIALKINIGAIASDFASGFNFSSHTEVSAGARRSQFFDLMQGWMSNPVIGAGHGTAAPNIIRNPEQPWAYELSYVALLYHTGILGILVYGSALGWTVLKAIKIVRIEPNKAGIILPLLAGLLCFLISNVTNPYLAKFDYLWTIFILVTVLNAYLVQPAKQTSSSSTGIPDPNF